MISINKKRHTFNVSVTRLYPVANLSPDEFINTQPTGTSPLDKAILALGERRERREEREREREREKRRKKRREKRERGREEKKEEKRERKKKKSV